MPKVLDNGVIRERTQTEIDGYAAEQVAYDAAAPQRAYDEAISQRISRYKIESDPLFLEAQYTGDPADLQAWRDKVAQIKLEIPLPSL